WGHRIPVWYCRAPGCEDVEIVGREDPTTCPRCGGSALEQDPDVLDTWFSSWLWPFSTLGWPDETRDLRAFYPTSTLVSAYDILFFWVSRMIMAGLEFMGEVPFREVYITRLVRDHLGRKMSKSLGNGIDPLRVVELFGADALRFTLVEGTSWTADLLLNYQDLEQAFAPGRNFANKLWNAGRFALLNLEGGEVRRVDEVRAELEVADRWILSRLNRAVIDTTAALETFRFHEVAGTVYHFFWDEVADWYIELVKSRLRGEAGEGSRAAAQATLVEVLDGVFRLLHPVMPFISEALWQRLPERPGVEREPSLVVARWPEPAQGREDAEAEAQLDALMELIGTVRALRSEYNIPVAAKVDVRIGHAPEVLRGALAAETRAVQRLAGVKDVYLAAGEPLAALAAVAGAAGGGAAEPARAGAGAHAVLRSGAEVFIPLAQVIDLDRERARVQTELERVLGQLRGTESKLANEQFRTKAPAEVVAKEEEKAANLREQHRRLARKIEELS
ncbi:MAG TPA: class I tRNA ligase family protein, partial [Longimicrobiales bacterium]|nr:class I tRNA ligase family protein [Longimicrobiales bacterium]